MLGNTNAQWSEEWMPESWSSDENGKNVVLGKPGIQNSRGRSTGQMEWRGPDLGT